MIASPYRPVLVTGPAEALLTLAEVKTHLRIDAAETAEDGLVAGLMAAAEAYLDGRSGVLGRCLVSQVWRVRFDCWHRCWRLPFADVASVVVRLADEAGIESEIDSGSYRLLEDAIGAYIRWDDEYVPPVIDMDDVAVWSVEMSVGYGAAADVPAPARQAALLLIGHWYLNRESVVTGTIATSVPMGVEMLIAPLRRVGM